MVRKPLVLIALIHQPSLVTNPKNNNSNTKINTFPRIKNDQWPSNAMLFAYLQSHEIGAWAYLYDQPLKKNTRKKEPWPCIYKYIILFLFIYYLNFSGNKKISRCFLTTTLAMYIYLHFVFRFKLFIILFPKINYHVYGLFFLLKINYLSE